MEKITSVPYIHHLLEKYTTQAKKHFGQNFLISDHVLHGIVKAADIQSTDTVVEIGPGLGVLTRELCLQAQQVISIEKDETMLQILTETIMEETPGAKRKITILNQDALHFDPSTNTHLKNKKYKLVANLPYNVATPILENFLVKTAGTQSQPTKIVVLVQKEVAEKACAKTGDLSVLSLAFQPFGELKIIATVSPGSFFPAPKVTSAILQIIPYETPLLSKEFQKAYAKLIHAAFSQKRKMLHTSLGQIMSKEEITELLAKAEVSPDIRPQNLPLEKWLTLASLAKL